MLGGAREGKVDHLWVARGQTFPFRHRRNGSLSLGSVCGWVLSSTGGAAGLVARLVVRPTHRLRAMARGDPAVADCMVLLLWDAPAPYWVGRLPKWRPPVSTTMTLSR